ncbi:aliphatic sulfonate ABC transporter substrate-binding protein [Acinetobacter equi]|uniref:aliphatic sulfonate ABC transporter substrate-binding protein n=1 Tax=Acinetobacter equi TaxID=1324350 RepID=UPI0009D6E39D
MNHPTEKIVIGFQKGNLNLITLKSEDNLLKEYFPNTKIEWKEFPAGPQMLEALSAGSVDIGSVGNTPPIFAQSGDKELRYVAYEQSHPKTQAIITANNNDQIQNLSDLKGKRIALQRGSSAHDLLDKILQNANLKWTDIIPIWLPPADARAAFDKKTIDAWVTWEPYLSVALDTGHAKVLTDSTPFGNSYSFIIANPTFVQKNPLAINQFIQAINDAAYWIVKNPEKALTNYANTIGLDKKITKQVINKRFQPSLIHPINEEVLKSQQKIADRFAQEKLIPKKIDINNVSFQVIP